MADLPSRNGAAIQKRRKPRTVSRYNVKMMEKLQKALKTDPCADLLVVLSENYPSMRNEIIEEEKEYRQDVKLEQEAKNVSSLKDMTQDFETAAGENKTDLPQGVLPQTATEIIFELTDEGKAALKLEDSKEGGNVSQALELMLRSSVLLCSPNTRTHLFRCQTGLVVKCFRPEQAANGKDFTQYTSIQYLESQIPNIPAPRAHGLLMSGRVAYMLMTFIPGQTLEEVWPLLTDEQKIGLRHELESILNQMRSHVNQGSTVLGGVQGEGCKDTRRFTRISSKPCPSSTSFYNFVYGAPSFGTSVYHRTLQSWIPPHSEQRIVFTHGDLRPANIHVVNDQDEYHISGFLDWEMSGFYPEWWETCKITNCMSTVDAWDWYLYLPPCVSPTRYLYEWLTDSFWDSHFADQYGIINIE